MKLLLTLMLLFVLPTALHAQPGYVEVTAPGNRQLKLAVEIPHAQNAASSASAAKEMASVIAFDMNMSGLANAEIREPLPLAGGLMFGATDFAPWLAAGFDMLVRGEYSISGDNLTVEFRLYDALNNKMMIAKRYLGKNRDLRRFAHSFCDEVLLQMTGERGPFTTHIAFISTQSGNKEVAVMDWDGHNLLPLTRNGSINLNPDFSPDGREIVFTSYKRGNPDLYKRALSSTVEIPLSKRKGLNITGAWSPDGTKIALALSKDGNAEIYTIARDGSNPVRLTVNPAIEVSPVWSPDGKRIAFVSDRLGKPQIFVMDANGGNVRRLTTAGGYNVNPRWSPKGDKIAYARMHGGAFHIYVINADGSGDTQLTTTGSNENPAWSPDGRFIAFSSKRGGPDGIYVMRADGSGQIRVSQGKGNGSQPAWSVR
ncbi:Tol-Pal system beta propeller repeat protein TolB [Oryzomonas japonica]|uniref:Tol-Pal system beta propeller repeat protein TolB n=1 Tax=Oryzomonas japonica TaxID=2603858 RepID=A0A7J4ZV58_9BACT|nr:Tol-Pal system beta propeller repeat protein TolB [Oryzomonas japonica]KAB0667329.1 Tol-Pal system beta propeller repeat protein TolB [Oryzomonas japonica]